MSCIYKYKGKDYTKDEFYSLVRTTMVQPRTVQKYEKILFPKGETAAKIEGHETIVENLKKIEEAINNPKKYAKWSEPEFRGDSFEIIGYSFFDGQHTFDYNTEKEFLENLNKKKQELKSQGVEKLKPIETFYEIKIGNILEKQFGKENVKTITDEYGNQWREVI